jgi:hypothetical protein
MNGEEGICAIVFAGKKLTQLEFFQLVDETSMFRRELLLRLGALRRIRELPTLRGQRGFPFLPP